MIKRLFGSQLRLNMVSGTATTAINAAVMLVAYPVYLHFLGYEIYGVWLVLATVLSFAQLGNLGIGQAVTKLVAEEHGRGDTKAIQQYVTTALALLCVSGAIALVLILLLRSQIIGLFKLSGQNAKTVAWLLPYVGVLSIYVFMVQTLNSTLSGLGRMDLANYAQSAGRIVAVATAATLLYCGRGIESLLIGNTLSCLSMHVASTVFISRAARIRILRMSNLDSKRGKRLFTFGGTVFGGSLINMLFSPFNKLMLSRYAGVASIPVYEIAFSGAMHVRGLIEAGLRALMPEISRLDGGTLKHARNRIIQIYHRAMRAILFLGIPMYGILAILSPFLLRLWLGDRFVETLPGAFRIMLIGTFLSLLGVPAYNTLMGTGHVRHNLGAHVAQATLNATMVLLALIVFTVSVLTVAWSASIAMAGSTVYLIFQAGHVSQGGTNKSSKSEARQAGTKAASM